MFQKVKKQFLAGISLFLMAVLLGGCGTVKDEAGSDNKVQEEQEKEDTGTVQPEEETEKTVVRIGGMKGPTSMGLLFLKEKAENGEALEDYQFTMVTAADELLPKMIKGELDIALVPANVAAILYQKTEGDITVIDINTLGVLYMVSGDETIEKVTDLKDKTIYLTGKGTTPDYVLHYILDANGLAEGEYTLEYKSEPTEVAALLAENPDAIGLLPQPFVTVACTQNEALQVVMDMNEQWNLLQGEGGSRMVTGVTVVRNAFLKEQEEAVLQFMQDHEESTAAINADAEKGAELVVEAGIIGKAPIAQKAIPNCNITYIDGADMKSALSGYLSILFEQDAASVGGELPADDFYYLP